MDINIDDLKYIIHSCFILRNFYEINKEIINLSYVERTNLVYSFSQQLARNMQLIITNYVERK